MTIVSTRCLWAVLAAWTIGVSNGFVTRPVVSSNSIVISTAKSTLTISRKADSGTGWDNFCIESMEDADSISPEIARRYRRTVYTHDDWVKHRQQDRFFIYLGSLFDSGVFRNSEREVYVCTTISAMVCVYNALAGGYTDLMGGQHGAIIPGLPVVGIPMTAFTVTSASLGLLLSK